MDTKELQQPRGAVLEFLRKRGDLVHNLYELNRGLRGIALAVWFEGRVDVAPWRLG